MHRCLELDLTASHSYGLARRVTEINEISGRGMMSLPPLPNDERKLPPAWLSAIRAALRTPASSVQQQWRRVADAVGRRGSLRVAVIGVSSSAGCGSGEAWELASPNGSRRVIVRGCSLDRSWIRRLADELVALRCRLAQNHTRQLSCLEGLRVTKTPEVAVSHKNAVGVGYFTTCPHTPAFRRSGCHLARSRHKRLGWRSLGIGPCRPYGGTRRGRGVCEVDPA